MKRRGVEWGVEIMYSDKISWEEWREKRREKKRKGKLSSNKRGEQSKIREKKIGEERRRYAVRKKCERWDEMRWDEMRWDEMRWDEKGRIRGQIKYFSYFSTMHIMKMINYLAVDAFITSARTIGSIPNFAPFNIWILKY